MHSLSVESLPQATLDVLEDDQCALRSRHFRCFDFVENGRRTKLLLDWWLLRPKTLSQHWRTGRRQRFRIKKTSKGVTANQRRWLPLWIHHCEAGSIGVTSLSQNSQEILLLRYDNLLNVVPKLSFTIIKNKTFYPYILKLCNENVKCSSSVYPKNSRN